MAGTRAALVDHPGQRLTAWREAPRSGLPQPQPLRAIVTAHILHLALHHLAKEVGGVDEVTLARVYAHVGYGPAPSCLLEEDQVAGTKIGLPDLLALSPLADRVVEQLLAEPLEDLPRQAGAVFRSVSPATPRRRAHCSGCLCASGPPSQYPWGARQSSPPHRRALRRLVRCRPRAKARWGQR